MPDAPVLGIIPWKLSDEYLLLKVKIEWISSSGEGFGIRKGLYFVIAWWVA
jgi:hypothetical protein